MSFIDQWRDFFPILLPGLWLSIQLAVASLVVGLPFGVVLALGATSRRSWVKWPVIGLVELGRGAPGLIVLYLVYYGLPQVGLTLQNFLAATVGLGISTAAYTSRAYNAASISFQFTAALTLAGAMYAVVSLTAVALTGAPKAFRRHNR